MSVPRESTPRPRRQRAGNDGANGLATSERIMKAANRLFLTYGYEGTTMKGIAREVGISAPALYWHYPSKVEIALACIDAGLQEVIAFVESQITSSSPVGQLEDLVRGYALYIVQRQKTMPAEYDLFRYGYETLVTYVPEEERATAKAHQRHIYNRLKAILQQGIENGSFEIEDVSVISQAILSMCDGLYTWYRPTGRLDCEGVARLTASFAKRMALGEAPVGTTPDSG